MEIVFARNECERGHFPLVPYIVHRRICYSHALCTDPSRKLEFH